MTQTATILTPTIIGDCTLYCGDCLDVLPTLSGVDAVVTDPPYGLSWNSRGFNKNKVNKQELSEWDQRPSDGCILAVKNFCDEVVIWGGNYFAGVLGDFRSPLLWDKQTGNNNFADGELAWTSFKTGTLRIFRHQWCGCFKDSERNQAKLHPTQKPVAVMEWCLSMVKGKTILDPFMGSGTTGVACVKTGRKFIGIEKEPKYFEIACERIRKAYADAGLFAKV